MAIHPSNRRPRAPLTWLDPGAFGTLGSGGGFALGAKLCRPDHDVWLVYGDGSLGFSVAEFDTFARHKVSWSVHYSQFFQKPSNVYIFDNFTWRTKEQFIEPIHEWLIREQTSLNHTMTSYTTNDVADDTTNNINKTCRRQWLPW